MVTATHIHNMNRKKGATFFIEYYELHTHFLLVVGSLVYSAFSIDFLLVSYWNFVDINYLNFFSY